MNMMACPHCKHTRFIRKMFDVVEINEEEDGLTDELVHGEVEETRFICRKCDKDVTNELISIDELGQIVIESLEQT